MLIASVAGTIRMPAVTNIGLSAGVELVAGRIGFPAQQP